METKIAVREIQGKITVFEGERQLLVQVIAMFEKSTVQEIRIPVHV